HPRRGDSRAAAASAGQRGRAHRGGGHRAAGERHRYRVRQRLRLPRLAGRSDVLGRRGRPRARDRDHEAARAAARRALASRSAPRASGSIGPGLEQRARLKQLPRRGNTVHRLLWVALLGSAAAVSYLARAEASAPDHQAPSLPATAAAWEALHEAQQNAARASAVEQALIGALAKRYPSPGPAASADAPAILGAYAAAMREVAARFPADLDVQTLCAEAEMTVNAWKL